jgi:drug/metabolite transporter (DMT)-like permease
MDPRERMGIAAGITSSALGGMAAAVTRYAVVTTDPVVVTIFRFGIGVLLLLPVAVAARVRWPRGADLLATVALGALFYGAFFVAYARALTLTTAARGSLGVAMLPVLTMVVAAALGRERLTWRKSLGVLIALGGVTISFATDLGTAPAGAWRGDLMMIAAMLSMSLYTIYSRPLMASSSALGYACVGMAAGSLLNLSVVSAANGVAAVQGMQAAQWAAAVFLGIVPGALGFYLWVYAVQRTTPTRVAATITVSPIFAGVLGALLVAEPVGIGLLVGTIAVAAGIWISSD